MIPNRPQTREQLKEYILRSLGEPVIEINIAPEQIEDRINDALEMWQEYHSDGTHRYYIAHEVTETDITNNYIELGDNVYTVNRVFTGKNGNGYSKNFLFNLEYQLRLSDLFDLRYADIGGYFIGKQYLDLLDNILNGYTISTYNRYERRLYIETNWERKILEGQFILADIYAFMDPEQYNDIYGDRVFRKLATAYCKRQWGENLMKFKNVALPGGLVLNGEVIYYEAKAEITEMETNFRRNYSDPDLFFVG